MATRKSAVVALIQPVAKRLDRIEALLADMRYKQDVHLKRVNRIQQILDDLLDPRILPPTRRTKKATK
jgi:hypothetical protein